MIYGTKMVYVYQELDGDKDVDKKLELSFNPITLIKYQGYLGREFMTDFMQLGNSNYKGLSKELKEKIDKGEEIKYEDLSNEDIEALSKGDIMSNMEFYINLTACMIATNEYPKKLDFGEIICSLPLFLFSDTNFIAELIDFISFGLKKNNLMAGQQLAQRLR